MIATTLNNKHIAIFDDELNSRERLGSIVKMQGGIPIIVSPPAPTLDNLSQFFKDENISLVACDHRLFDHKYANYFGAQAVAESYHQGIGGVLITAYENADAELSIREYRMWIPVLIHSTELNQVGLKDALLQADCEVRLQQRPQQREPFRTIMTIKQIVHKGNKSVVKVIMSQWNPNEEVGFPLNMVPQEMQESIVPGNMLIAQVNIGASRSEDLYFHQFELPDSNALKKSKTFFNHS